MTTLAALTRPRDLRAGSHGTYVAVRLERLPAACCATTSDQLLGATSVAFDGLAEAAVIFDAMLRLGRRDRLRQRHPLIAAWQQQLAELVVKTWSAPGLTDT
jgi:hypothetical protein